MIIAQKQDQKSRAPLNIHFKTVPSSSLIHMSLAGKRLSMYSLCLSCASS